MSKAELVFLPAPGVGHLVSTMEIARRLVDRDERLSAIVLVMNLPPNPLINMNPFSKYLSAPSPDTRIRFIELPQDDIFTDIADRNFLTRFIESYKPHVRNIIAELMQRQHGSHDTPRLAGLVHDMLCPSMIIVAKEFGLPTYMFFTSGAAFLGFMLHTQIRHDEDGMDVTDQFKDSDAVLDIPCLKKQLPVKVFPLSWLSKDTAGSSLGLARKFRETSGIMVNTSVQLEPYSVNSLCEDDKVPPVYPVGPILSLAGDHAGDNTHTDTMKWLDHQPPSSVVFLCFGSMGCFGRDQIKEIAYALERSGYRFLWSLREAPHKGRTLFPQDYANPGAALPEGFLDRTAGTGKVMGWAPQVKVLAHPAIGGFVSHCGWNSILESTWFGVPIAVWPHHAEQQFNAFEMVTELGLSEEIRMDFRREPWAESSTIITAEEILRGLRSLMESESEVRKRVKEISERSREALVAGGSSHSSLGRFIHDVFDHMS